MAKRKRTHSPDGGEEKDSLDLIYDNEKWVVLTGDSISSIGCSVVHVMSRRDKDVLGKITIRNSVAEWKYAHKFTGKDKKWTVRIDAIMAIAPDVSLTIREELIEKVVESPTETSQLYPVTSRTLKVDNERIPVSRELVALHSTFFEKLFYQDFAESKQQTVTIGTYSSELIHNMYSFLIARGKTTLTKDEACSLLEMSDFLDAPFVRRIAVDFMKNIHTTSLSNLIKILVIADRINEQELIEHIVNLFQNSSDIRKFVDALPDSVSCGTMKKFLLKTCDMNMDLLEKCCDLVFFRFVEGIVIVKLDKNALGDSMQNLVDVFSKRCNCGSLLYNRIDSMKNHWMKFACSGLQAAVFTPPTGCTRYGSEYYLRVSTYCSDIWFTTVGQNTVGRVIEGDDILKWKWFLTPIDYGLYPGRSIFVDDEDNSKNQTLPLMRKTFSHKSAIGFSFKL